MKPKDIAEKARNSLGDYCFKECKAYCCRKGYLRLSRKEAEAFGKANMKKIGKNTFSLYIGEGCPALKGFKCSIQEKKPLVCRQFPIFMEGRTVRLSYRCPAVREGKFYPFIAELLRMGFRLAERNDYSDMDFEKLELKN